jgi:hypothetical protein
VSSVSQSNDNPNLQRSRNHPLDNQWHRRVDRQAGDMGIPSGRWRLLDADTESLAAPMDLGFTSVSEVAGE